MSHRPFIVRTIEGVPFETKEQRRRVSWGGFGRVWDVSVLYRVKLDGVGKKWHRNICDAADAAWDEITAAGLNTPRLRAKMTEWEGLGR